MSLPIPFNDFTVAARDKNGKEMVTYGIGSKSAEGYRFSVTEFPRKSITHEIDLKGYPEKLRAKGRRVTNEKYFEFDGQQAVQCQVPDSRTSAVMRVVEFPSGVFILIVEYPTKLETKLMPLVEPFFASLEVTE